MPLRTSKLHLAFAQALGSAVVKYSSVKVKPFCIDLQLPLPPRLRVYAYNLVGGSVSPVGAIIE